MQYIPIFALILWFFGGKILNYISGNHGFTIGQPRGVARTYGGFDVF